MDAHPPQPVQQTCAVEARVTEADAAQVLLAMKGKLPRTPIQYAKPAPVCGLVQLHLDNGNVAFTDKEGRYLIMGLMVDTATGQFVSHPAPVQDSQETE